MSDQQSAIESGDIGIFSLPTQTSSEDRRTLLALQNIAASRGPYHYLEIGSHLGGSLLPHILDVRCRSAISIDTRPEAQPDARGAWYAYEDNSTARMVALIRDSGAPESEIEKLRTYDSNAAVAAESWPAASIDLAFIDGEHTVVAVVSDFLAILPSMKSDAIVAFHDADVVFQGLLSIENVLRFLKVEFVSAFLPDGMFAIATGAMTSRLAALAAEKKVDRQGFLDRSEHRLHRSIWRAQSPVRHPRRFLLEKLRGTV